MLIAQVKWLSFNFYWELLLSTKHENILIFMYYDPITFLGKPPNRKNNGQCCYCYDDIKIAIN